jgi:hypothetical protein
MSEHKLMSEEICGTCDNQDCCFIYQNLNDGRDWYEKLFGLKRICPHYRERPLDEED